ncbi:MBL fold metallo-hydrolase [Nafulsella turpanensis]|uniref:MBL fold metallo-hydrolase n=1 Tax=Nafulsella turpanensis TaxID=1265690 RepID=UPI000344A84E|nr:MBL fold metallo-hydrolase [Nafulsella turpanensis]
MKIHQIYDKGLAHASYAVVSKGEMAVVDPARDPQPYYDFARDQQAKIVAVIETHPHADFISSHLEIHQHTGATIYASSKIGALYPHKGFDKGDSLKIGELTLEAYNTPGHSPDSISILVMDKEGQQHSIFTGDTLFVGDVGRPDLREKGGEMESMREHLARQMYHSTRNVLMQLERDVLVYPAHGAGSLCGKNLSTDLSSTIGRELDTNYALQEMPEEKFVNNLLEDQPFIPKYFKNSVELNKRGAAPFKESIAKVTRLTADEKLEEGVLIIDSRDQLQYKNAHLPGSVNLMDGLKFETWLGSIVGPDEPFYLIADDEETLESLIRKSAKIGYEGNIKGAMVADKPGEAHSRFLNLEHFKANKDGYHILDVRNAGEVQEGKIFEQAQAIPLHELRERAGEVPVDKPVMVHCAAGYRSAAGFSILENLLPDAVVYDLGEAIKEFK